MLHITNGDHAARLIAATGVGGEVLPWRDVLHEGPVPEGLSLDELRPVRAPFIAGALWRHLEQFPSVQNGLSRSERQALEAVASGPRSLRDAFVAANEER